MGGAVFPSHHHRPFWLGRTCVRWGRRPTKRFRRSSGERSGPNPQESGRNTHGLVKPPPQSLWGKSQVFCVPPFRCFAQNEDVSAGTEQGTTTPRVTALFQGWLAGGEKQKTGAYYRPGPKRYGFQIFQLRVLLYMTVACIAQLRVSGLAIKT